jgi:AraC-like DNA-binding protein
MSKNTDERLCCLFPTKTFEVSILFGSYRWLRSWNWPAISHDYWRLYWNADPGGWLVDGNSRIELMPDRVLLLPPHTGLPCRSNRSFRHFYIHFIPPEPYDLVKRRPLIFDSGFVRQYIDRLRSEDGIPYQPQILQLILNFYLLQIPASSFLDSKEAVIDSRVATVVRRFGKPPWNKINNRAICKKLGIPLNEFYRLFKKEIGTTPKQYIVSVRMETARRLLIDTALTLDEIAEQTGYANRYQFSKSFRNFYQESPIRFRNNSH